MENNTTNIINTRLLLRIAADLEKEMVRQTDAVVKVDLETQVNGLKTLYKEIEDFRTIKRILNINS